MYSTDQAQGFNPGGEALRARTEAVEQVCAQAPHIEVVAKRLHDLLDRTRALRTGLIETADRLLGVMPEPACGQAGNRLNASGSLGAVSDLLDDVMREMERLNEVRSRLGTL